MKLYRDEAVNHQRSKLLGDVVFHASTKLFVIIVCIMFLLGSSAFFLFTQTYKSKAKVSGYLIPKGGLTTIVSEQFSIIQRFYVEPGERIVRNQNLILMGSAKSLSSGKILSEELINSLDREIEQINQRINNENTMQEVRIKASVLICV